METLFLTLLFISLVVTLLTDFFKTGLILTVGSLVGYYYFAQVDNWAAIILLFIGLSLIILEIFVPDFGLIGIIGFVAIVFSLYYTSGDLGKTLTDLIIASAFSALLVIFLLKKGYSFTNWERFVLTTQIKNEEQTESIQSDRKLSAGMLGHTITPLRPSGKARFEDEDWTYDVLSDDGHIMSGQKIIIQEIIGKKILVRKI